MITFTWGDRKHWEIGVARFELQRWCPGAPCHLPGMAYRTHWVTPRIYRRAHSARLDT